MLSLYARFNSKNLIAQRYLKALLSCMCVTYIQVSHQNVHTLNYLVTIYSFGTLYGEEESVVKYTP